MNSKDGGPDDFIAGFSVSPAVLFKLTFTQVGPTYIPAVISSNQVLVNVPLFKWTLENYTPTVLISIEEVDNTETVTQTETRTSTYAGNFDINATILKIGLKFGASAQVSNTKTATTTYTVGSDDLYSALTYFSDKVIIQDYTGFRRWKTLEYSTGYCLFSMEPIKYQ